MRLEDEIKTRQFRSERQKAQINLIFTHNWAQNKMAEVFKAYDITGQQYNILRILRGQFPKPCNIQLLKDRMLDKQPDVSRLVDRLVQKDLVDRKVSEKDRRKMDILITQKGLDLLAVMDPAVNSLDDLTNSLSDEEVATLNMLLDKLRD